MGVELLVIAESQESFLDSRLAALELIKDRFSMVLPMQDDFLLEREPDRVALDKAMQLLHITQSVRLMPCPGPGGPLLNNETEWATMTQATDQYGFSFQATMWRMDACLAWYRALCAKLEAEWPLATTDPKKRRTVEIHLNFAENADGQRFFWKQGGLHIGWKRVGSWPNAVYLSPWPYRPTAIVYGELQPWAAELGKREGMPITL